MKKMLLFFSHKLNLKQKKEAQKKLNVEEFVTLPSDLQQKWSNVDPYIEMIDMKPFLNYMQNNTKKGDVVLIQGDYGATCKLVSYAKKLELIPVYSTVVRGDSIADENDDNYSLGEFKHCRFRRYS